MADPVRPDPATRDLRDRIADALPDVDAVMTIVNDALWMARNSNRSGRCRWCHSKTPRPGPRHGMSCQNYEGPLTHAWVRLDVNGTFGGIDHWCSCGGWFRQGGLAGHGDGTEQAEPICPDAGKPVRALAERGNHGG